jgi:aspartyl protease family protein
MPGSDNELVLLGMNVLSQFDIVQRGKKLVLKRNQ